MNSVIKILPSQYDISPLLEQFRDAMAKSGESVPESWVDERVNSIASGQEFCLGIVDADELLGILQYSYSGTRANAIISWSDREAGREDLVLLIREYVNSTPPGMRLRISGVHPGVPQELMESVASGFSFVLNRRFEMTLELGKRYEITPPGGFEFSPLLQHNEREMASLDMQAFQGTVDEHLFAETEEENRQLMKSLLSGDFGPVVSDASLYITAEQKPAGMIAVTDLGSDGFIADIAILQEFRKRGLGKYLVLNAANKCMELKKRRLALWVSEKNTPAYSLYTSLGFQKTREGLYYMMDRRTAPVPANASP